MRTSIVWKRLHGTPEEMPVDRVVEVNRSPSPCGIRQNRVMMLLRDSITNRVILEM